MHGYTFVPEIFAKDVLEAIAESAFKTSEYPVILSFENHCNPRQQVSVSVCSGVRIVLKVHSELKFILLDTVSTLVYSLSHKVRN